MQLLEINVRITSQYNMQHPEAYSASAPETFEAMERSARVAIWKDGFATTLGITSPRWDATNVFHAERSGTHDYPQTEEQNTVFRQNSGTYIPEYFTDVTQNLAQTVREAKRLGVETENDEIQEALTDLGVQAAYRLDLVHGQDTDVYGRMQQFIVNTMQKIQLEITNGHAREFDVRRKFDKEFEKLANAKKPVISSSDEQFMHLEDVNRWEKVTMSMIEETLGPENVDDFMKVRNAVLLASHVHKDQTHLGLSPYMVHIYRVMVRILEDPYLGEDTRELSDTLAIAGLHDVLEDTDITPGELEDMFGSKITDGVLALSKWIKVSGDFTWDPTLYYDTIRRQGKSVRGVKGYDRVDNWYASHKKVDTAVEDRARAEADRLEYYRDTTMNFEEIVADNPVLADKLQQAVFLKPVQFHEPDVDKYRSVA